MIIHDKVAARVVCVFSDQDAHIAARAERQQQQLQQHDHQQHAQQPGANSSSSHSSISPSPGERANQTNGGLSFSFAQGSNNAGRRTPMQATGLSEMGGMGGGNVRPPGKAV
jgi:hypothetical protein